MDECVRTYANVLLDAVLTSERKGCENNKLRAVKTQVSLFNGDHPQSSFTRGGDENTSKRLYVRGFSRSYACILLQKWYIEYVLDYFRTVLW